VERGGGPVSAFRIGWSFAVLAVGVLPLASGWVGVVPVVVFVAAIAATYVFVFAAKALRAPAGFTVVVLLAVVVVGAYFVSAPDHSAEPWDVLSGMVPRLLTAQRPAPATPGMLAPGVLLAVVVALAVSLSLTGKGRTLLGPVIGGAILYVAGALLTAGRADQHGFVALVLVALVGAGWLEGRVRLLVPTMLVAALTLVAGVLPANDAFEPRTLVKPPVTDLDASSPLPQLARWANAGDMELFRVSGPEVPLRLVALSDYTGATWRAASLYGPIGAVAPPDLPAGAKTAAADLEVTIGDLTGPWLPTAGRPRETDADTAVVDPDSGSLVLPGGLRKGVTYTVKSIVDVPVDSDLLMANVPTAKQYLALPGLPFSLAEYARRTVANAHTPFEQAVAIEEVVRTGRKPDAGAPVGSSYARLETFLFGAPGTSGANAGTAEQFASAFAVLARAVGLPSRVVVGFKPVAAGPDGVAVVRASDATAWPEVYFAKWGWVAFDPVSGTATGAGSAAKRDVINRLATPVPTPSIPATTGPVMPPRGPVAAGVAPPRSGQAYALLLLVLVPFGVLGLLRALRRSRLRRAGPTGAWAYVLDSMLLAGRSPARHRPAPDIARDLIRYEPEAVRLAEIADRAAFAPDPLAHQDAWPLALRVRAGLRRAVPWHRRVFWSLDPRPLWRR
jgi:transglutaminase-like putative cysteine protease